MINTHSIIRHMITKLFAAEDRRFQKIIDQLHKQNQEALSIQLDGFMFQGKFYKPSNAATGGGLRKTLHLSLWDQMQAFLNDKSKIDNDATAIRQMLFKLIDPAPYIGGDVYQNIRDAIPDCIADTLPPEIGMLSRMGHPDFKTLSDLRQYNKILPLIEFYSATRLLY